MTTADEIREPIPPFTLDDAIDKVHLAEDGWNSRDSESISLAYTHDSHWRSRCEYLFGRDQIVLFLNRKWQRELEYRLINELWSHSENRIAVRFVYEWQDSQANWTRSYGNENWAYNHRGLVLYRFASINDLEIDESERLFHWPLGSRPACHAGLSDLGL